MRKKLFMCFSLSLLLLCGCGKANNEPANATNSSETVVSDELGTSENTATSFLGQITEINGDVYTITLAEQPQGMPQGGEGEAPQGMPQGGEGEAPQGMPQGGEGEAPQGKPQGGEGEAPQGKPQGGEGEVPQGMPQGGEGQIVMNGEIKEIEINDNTSITINGESATKDELKVDDIVNVEMSEETVVSISVGFAEKIQQNKQE